MNQIKACLDQDRQVRPRTTAQYAVTQLECNRQQPYEARAAEILEQQDAW